MPERKGRGGKREGAGRPPSPAPLKTLSVRLPPAVIERLRAFGGGNASRGVRRLYDEHFGTMGEEG